MDELAIVIAETKKGMDLLDGARGWKFLDNSNFLWIRMNACGRHNAAKIIHLGAGKVALAWFKLDMCTTEALEDLL